MSLGEVAEVVWPMDCPGEEVSFCRCNVKEVINGTGEDTNPCGGAVCVGDFLGCVGEERQSDCVECAIVGCEKDVEFCASCL